MAKKKLLIANDDMAGVDSKFFQEMLGRNGVDAFIVASVKEAMDLVEKHDFDLIITDISLAGGRTGLDLIRQIRKINKTVKIVVATGFGDYYEKEAKTAGADLYFEKPLDLQKHILGPLGISEADAVAIKPTVSTRGKLSVRMAMHDLGNKHNCAVLVSSSLKAALKNFMEKEKINDKTKELFVRAIEDLEDIEQAGKSADELVKKLSAVVYKKLDPDVVGL
jgi:CheY-like chemotaxis protein